MPRFAALLFCCGLVACYRPQYRGPYSCEPSRGSSDCPPGFSCVDRLCVSASSKLSEGCTSGGTLLVMARGARVFACTGSFAAGDPASLCNRAAGMHVCGSDPRDDDVLPLLDCAGASGFFVVQAPLAVMSSGSGSGFDALCSPPPGPSERAILGCGASAEAVTLNPPGCHSLQHALRCPQSGAWSCSAAGGLLDLAHDASLDAAGGTLCCSGPLPR